MSSDSSQPVPIDALLHNDCSNSIPIAIRLPSPISPYSLRFSCVLSCHSRAVLLEMIEPENSPIHTLIDTEFKFIC